MTLQLPEPKGAERWDYERNRQLEAADRQNVKRGSVIRGRVLYERITWADADATPSVANGAYFVTANTGATTITDLDDGVVGQVVFVEIADANTTIDFTASGLRGNVGVDWSPTTGDHMTCIYNGTDWLCTVSDNTA